MNLKTTFYAGISLCVALTSCVDNDYDLGNLDTLVKVPVNDLTIPVNVEPVKLENIFNIDENDPNNCVKVVNGEYAVSRDGHFESDNIEVNEIRMSRPVINSSTNIISLKPELTRASAPQQLSFGVHSEARDFTYSSSNVSSYIQGIGNIKCNMTLKMDINFRELQGKVSGISLTDISLQLPKGLKGVTVEGHNSSYTMQTGVLTIPSATSTGATLSIVVHASELDFAFMESINEAEFTPSTTDADNGYISIMGAFYLLDGVLTINESNISGSLTQLPSQLTMTVDYTTYDTTVSEFTGDLHYQIKDVDIPSAELNNLPDILTQETTNLALENPQIYLTITNPFVAYDLMAATGLKITAHRTGKPDKVFVLDQEIKLNASDAVNGKFHFVLSPSDPTVRPEGMEDAKWLLFSDLGYLLAGEGLPTELSFDLVNPYVPTQHIDNFKLGVNIGTVDGDYNMLAPLGMKEGSQIVYSDNFDGWASEDLDCCTIERLSISTNASSNIPIDVTLTGYPIDEQGNRIYGANGEPVEIDGAIIPANAQNHHIYIHTTTTIPSGSNLNGIRFVATAVANEPNSPVLSPDMTIILDHIRVTADGYYIKDLDD